MAATPDEAIQTNRSRLLFAVVIAGIALYAVLDGSAQTLPPHYSAISQAESDLAVGPYGYIMTINFINRGMLSLCFLFALALSGNSYDTTGPRFRRGGHLFALWSVGALVLAAFPTDVPPAPLSWHGAVHLVVAIAAFLGGSFGALYLSLGMSGNKALERAMRVAVPLAALTIVLCLVEVAVAPLLPGFSARYGGAIERAFLGSVLLWVGAVSWVMVCSTESRASGAPTQLTL